MATPKRQQAAKGAKSKDKRPCRQTQGIRSARNKIRRVKRHCAAHPNDSQSKGALERLIQPIVGT